jgi:hypothetical protein
VGPADGPARCGWTTVAASRVARASLATSAPIAEPIMLAHRPPVRCTVPIEVSDLQLSLYVTDRTKVVIEYISYR